MRSFKLKLIQNILISDLFCLNQMFCIVCIFLIDKKILFVNNQEIL